MRWIGFLHFGIEILHAQRGAVETDFAQRDDVVAREPARINFHAGFDICRRKVKWRWMISPSRRISSGSRKVGEPPPK